MSDTALVSVVTGATAVFSGLLGYGAARGQQLIERARLAAEVSREREQRDERDRERHLLAKAESAARRETLYLEYLRVLDEYTVMVMTEDVVPAMYSEWWQRFQALDNQMDLFALPPVVEANRAVYAALDAVTTSLHSTQAFAAEARAGFRLHRNDFEIARERLVAAMHNEIVGSSADGDPYYGVPPVTALPPGDLDDETDSTPG